MILHGYSGMLLFMKSSRITIFHVCKQAILMINRSVLSLPISINLSANPEC